MFSSVDGPIPRMPLKLLPVHSDPPEQRGYRKLLNPSLTPQRVAALEPTIRAVAEKLLDAVAAAETFDYCTALAVPLPQEVALMLIGFPLAERQQVAGWIDDMVRLRTVDPPRVVETASLIMGRLNSLVDESRDAEPDETFVSLLLDAEVDGRPIEPQERIALLALLLFGGLDTTTSAIAGAMWYLAQHEPAWRELQSAGVSDLALEEFVRWTSPVQGNARTATRDVTVAGCPVGAGERVFLMWGSGNRDEREFPDPDDVVLDRFPNRHLGFGMGPHRCVGAALGKLMLRVALESTLARFDRIEIADNDAVRWVEGETRGIRALPVRPTAKHDPPPTAPTPGADHDRTID